MCHTPPHSAIFVGSGGETLKNIPQIGDSLKSANRCARNSGRGKFAAGRLSNALLHDPDVLILDEPTTGLDPNQLVDIRNLIKNVGKTKTVFLSTHIMQEVEAMCERVIIINKGEIVADKKLKDLRDEKEQTVIVEFDYRVEDVFLLKLPKVDRVINTHEFVYEITFKTSEDMRSYVFDFAHDNQLKILQLNQKNASLESLFRELTS